MEYETRYSTNTSRDQLPADREPQNGFMNTLPLSVIIPTHGRPEYLPEAIESVFAQNAMPCEIIVVSDESEAAADRVRGALEVYTNYRTPIRLLRNEEFPGASGSRNLGATQAIGEWFAFLDDDDLWTPHFLERCWAIATATNSQMVVSWVEMFRSDQRAPGVNIRPGLTADDAGSRTPGLTGSNFIITKHAFDEIGGFDTALPVMNDIDFMYRYLLAGGRYEVNAEMDMLQRRHAAGQLTRATTMRADGIRKYAEKHRETLRFNDRRHLRLIEYRTRYRAVTSRARKAGYYALGLINASPADVLMSLGNRSKRGLWHEASR